MRSASFIVCVWLASDSARPSVMDMCDEPSEMGSSRTFVTRNRGGAQATATCASMLEGRFEFGAGSGENLNEHHSTR